MYDNNHLDILNFKSSKAKMLIASVIIFIVINIIELIWWAMNSFSSEGLTFFTGFFFLSTIVKILSFISFGFLSGQLLKQDKKREVFAACLLMVVTILLLEPPVKIVSRAYYAVIQYHYEQAIQESIESYEFNSEAVQGLRESGKDITLNDFEIYPNLKLDNDQRSGVFNSGSIEEIINWYVTYFEEFKYQVDQDTRTFTTFIESTGEIKSETINVLTVESSTFLIEIWFKTDNDSIIVELN